MKVFAIIPALEAVSSVGRVVEGLKNYVAEIVVVDDGSTDDTAQVAQKAGAQVLRHLVNRGYGAALITGSAYALARGAEAIVHFDADGQFTSADLPKLLAALKYGQPSAALGSRFLGTAVNIPVLRKIILKLGIIFTWATTGLKLTDAHNGLRAFTREAWVKFNLKQDRMAISSEIIQEIAEHKIPYMEVPVTVTYTADTLRGSKQGRMPAIKIVRDLFIGKFLR
ncbi:MAG TPA: glycosyltransferase family 2 protein [Candidatus Veblenbacteria bacterium]|uniref:Glycosyltransferase 2-like domain-containing protein n=1 Tax=Candidatus Veblenbacteria bacterium RIFOXYA2_FULL_43_9 TaxID=1802425 RepID=A0A1G2Q4T0_9BACT|nr:MAG: hypothetical protein A2226_03380 [Candidatus Veblenbacteria bacterium RIFOXYA2_FULL_43_9]HCX39233.1 glycosyltransferase family 2 protein [Candidatus Veblenbacteria bacterium]